MYVIKTNPYASVLLINELNVEANECFPIITAHGEVFVCLGLISFSYE